VPLVETEARSVKTHNFIRWFENGLYAALGRVSAKWLAEYRSRGIRAEIDAYGVADGL